MSEAEEAFEELFQDYCKIVEAYEKLLQFTNKIASLNEPEYKILALADAGYRMENILEARKILKEIGEMP